ncbi:cell division protein FtsZ [Flavicella sediminum]|uniref:cell division protein FtsZ n=1 Tax=Flavicella sediminum TaxID=2585141 RepID=UPI0011202E23|nr:cell division protein FtsZ [Flavicella sediminum]
MSSTEFDNISFDMPKTQSNTIKVIGVGGGGSNAVNHMFQQNTKGVDFVICNTDAQALDNSPIPNKIQLGVSLTSGLGAGANPEIGEEAAKESLKEIQEMLTTQTKMVFITAGMGGGTGTGAAPIIAKIAKDLDILTVGIVTMPFQFEGRRRTQQAQKGIDELRQNVDSLIVINNNKLREVYGNLGFKAGFSKADEVLSTASRGIAEVITHHYKQNIDLHDAKTVLSNSGTAIMGSSKEAGANRAKNAIVKALDSPLLNDNKITGAKNVLLLIVSGEVEVTLDEIGEINDFIQIEAGYDANIIMGVGEDESLGDAIAVTVVATGFAADQQCDITNTEVKRIIHTLEDEQKATYNFGEKNSLQQVIQERTPEAPKEPKKIVHLLGDEEEEVPNAIVKTTSFIQNLDVVYEEVLPEVKAEEITLKETVSLDLEDDFVIHDAVKKTPTEEEKIEEQVQMDLLFDMPVVDHTEVKQEEPVYFNLEDNADEFVNSIEVVDPVEVKQEVPEVEKITRYTLEEDTVAVNEMEVKDAIEVTKEAPKVIRYSLADFENVEPTIKNASTIDINEINVVDHKVVRAEKEEMTFELKTKKATKVEDMEVFEAKEVSPLDLTISELQQRTNSRREKMKKFNYKFMNNASQNVDDIEKQPAYKRMGIDLQDAPASDATQSRTTLSVDDNDEIQLRSNNSFLHDNVD